MASPGWVIVNGVFRFGSSVLLPDGTAALPSLGPASNTGNGLYFISGQNPAISNSGLGQLGIFNGTIQLPSSTQLGWGTGALNTTTDTKIGRIAAGVSGANIVGASTQTGGFPVSIFTSTTLASNGTTVETDLISYAMPASVLNVNNQKLRVTAFGLFSAAVSTKTIKLYFGTTAVTAKATSATSVGWRAQYEVIRTGAATQVANGWNNTGNTLQQDSVALLTETLSNAVTIKVTGQDSVGSGTVTAYAMFVEWIP